MSFIVDGVAVTLTIERLDLQGIIKVLRMISQSKYTFHRSVVIIDRNRHDVDQTMTSFFYKLATKAA